MRIVTVGVPINPNLWTLRPKLTLCSHEYVTPAHFHCVFHGFLCVGVFVCFGVRVGVLVLKNVLVCFCLVCFGVFWVWFWCFGVLSYNITKENKICHTCLVLVCAVLCCAVFVC